MQNATLQTVYERPVVCEHVCVYKKKHHYSTFYLSSQHAFLVHKCPAVTFQIQSEARNALFYYCFFFFKLTSCPRFVFAVEPNILPRVPTFVIILYNSVHRSSSRDSVFFFTFRFYFHAVHGRTRNVYTRVYYKKSSTRLVEEQPRSPQNAHRSLCTIYIVYAHTHVYIVCSV